jgi:bifunctional DNA-binding transcriptional regulator/antitoxin component of YhaV-PrlF toxin-antitoxin module
MQNTINQWTSIVEKDAYGDFFIVIPESIQMQLGWKPGDALVWTIHEDNSVTLSKKDHNDQKDRIRL